MATRWKVRNGMVVALGLGGLAASIAPRYCPAEEVPRPLSLPAVHPLDRAVGVTLKDGWPTVVVITSSASLESQRLLQSLQLAPQAHALSQAGQIVSLGMEANAARMRRMGVTSAPVILVYGRGSKGLELAGRLLHPKDAESAIAWLEALGAVPASSAMADAAVVRTGHQHNASPQASPQAPPPVYQAPPSPQPAPPPQAAPPTVLAPVMSSPSQVPVVVSAPSTPVVFQPQAATIVVGPQPPPNIVFASAPPSAPNIMMMAPSSPTPNMFMAAPAPQPVAAPQPMMAPAPQPMMAAGAPVPQQSLATTATIGLLLNNPGVIDRLLGAIGRHLATRGQPRIQMSPATPASFSPTLVTAAQAGMFSLPTGQVEGGVPAVPQQLYYVPPQGQGAPSQPTATPQGYANAPSPQSNPPANGHPSRAQGGKRFRLFHHD